MMIAKKVKYFILVTVMPLLSIAVIFSYAFFHIQEEINLLSSKIKALTLITHIEKIVFDIQKIRGLSCIEKQNEKSTQNLQIFKKDVFKNLISLQQKLFFIKNDDTLKNELSEFLNFVEKNLKNMSFEELTEIVHKFMSFSYRVSYSFKLPLESELNNYILINNIVYLLPEIIEHNGQIRAIASSISDAEFSSNQKMAVVTQIDKIKEKLRKLENNLLLLYKSSQSIEIREYHDKMVQAQKNITQYAQNGMFESNISAESNDVFVEMTKNINSIIELYDSNLNFLNKSLKENRELSIYVLFAGFASMLFVLYINMLLYYKNRKFVDKIEELTITDGMTALYNRRYFDEVFENSLKIQQRTKQTLAFIMLDIDFFKLYNDTYGHQAGDMAIKAVAQELKNALKRAADMAFRLGGEEFGVLCIGMSRSEALDFANKIREEIENRKIEHEKNKASRHLTVSMGLIVIEPDIINSVSEIYRCADEALYQAKENGRNRVVVYDAKAFC